MSTKGDRQNVADNLSTGINSMGIDIQVAFYILVLPSDEVFILLVIVSDGGMGFGLSDERGSNVRLVFDWSASAIYPKAMNI